MRMIVSQDDMATQGKTLPPKTNVWNLKMPWKRRMIYKSFKYIQINFLGNPMFLMLFLPFQGVFPGS